MKINNQNQEISGTINVNWVDTNGNYGYINVGPKETLKDMAKKLADEIQSKMEKDHESK
jgi:hypothetical protein